MCQMIFYRTNKTNILFVRFRQFPRNYFYSCFFFSFRLDPVLKESRRPHFVSIECILFEQLTL